MAFGLGALLLAAQAGAVPRAPWVAAPRAGAMALRDLQAPLAQGLDRPAAKRSRLAARLLVLLVDFADQPHATTLTPAAVDSLYFARASPSVRDFYLRSSFGRLRLEGFVTPWLRLPQTYAYYSDAANEAEGVRGTYPRNARRMAEDAVRAADPLVDFRSFDDDGPDGVPSSGDDDGEIDALVVLHAGEGAELGNPRDILSHSWTTLHALPTADGPVAWDYCTVSESSPLGVRAHEFGHLLGLPDLYDRRSSPPNGGGLGDWTLMASGAWLDGGRTPADLDATSKILLGFVDPIVPSGNGIGLPLRAAAPGAMPDVYEVWTHGLPGLEYFVLENRRRAGQDAALPGSGMLVYHVDLSRSNDDDPDHPRIQLLQADGREDIDVHFNNGDGGDPFPGDSGVQRLDGSTRPSTRARDGSSTQVEVASISDPGLAMSFDLRVDLQPLLTVAGVSLREIAGDGDGVPEAGERLALKLDLRNLGLDTGGFDLRVAAVPDSDALWTTDTARFVSLAKLDSATVTFELTPAPGRGDPAALALRALALGSGGWQQSLDLAVGLGERGGFRACLEPRASRFTRDCSDPALPWRVESLDGSGCWTLEPRAGEFGSVWRSACGARYANGSDVTLVSPPFNLHSGSELRILHGWETQSYEVGWALDGGFVEISLDGGSWVAREPRGGYPRRLWRDTWPALLEQGVFAGQSARHWDTFDFGSHSGSARLRFHFVSNDSVGASGWEIARVEVAPPEPEPQVSLALQAEPNPAHFPLQVAFRTSAPLTWGALATTLRIYDARGRLVRTLDHAPVPAESALFEWDGMDRAGRLVASGTYLARLEWGGRRATCKFLVLR